MMRRERSANPKGMTSANFRVVLDACVLIPPTLCDLLLRLAEHPRMYAPKWTVAILEEVRRNQLGKVNFPLDLADSWRQEVTRHFPEAMVTRYEPYEDGLSISPEDRHVLAAAIRCEADLIVTFNLRHFPSEVLAPFDVEAMSPGAFLSCLYGIRPQVVLAKLDDIARDRNRTRADILRRLDRLVPGFAQALATDLDISLERA